MPIPPADKRPYQPNVVHYTTLVDENGLPYKAQNVVNQVEGDFDPTGLATEAKQDAEIAALGEVVDALGQTLSVVSTNDEFPLPVGAATDTKQDQILAALANLAGLLGNPLTVSINGEPLEVDVTSLPLAPGAATAANQGTGNQRLLDILTALGETLDVSGEVSLTADTSVGVSGSVEVSNTVSVSPSGTFTVSVTGGATSAKQDQVLAALGTLLTAIQAPQPVTDNGSSLTVDGVVGISGEVAVNDGGNSLTVDGSVAATQSGTWNVGITGTPAVNVGSGPWPVADTAGNAVVTATAAPAAGDRGVVVRNIPSGTQTVSVSGTAAVTNTPANAATLTTSPTAVSVGTTSVQLAASLATRKSVLIQNMGGTNLLLSFAATAVATTPTLIVPANGGIEIARDTWTGVVTAIRASGSAADAIVTVVS